MAGKQGIFSSQADWPDGIFDRIGVEFETTIIEEAGEPLPMSEAITDIFGKLEPEEIIDSCFSNHGFRAAMIGAECSRRAARTRRVAQSSRKAGIDEATWPDLEVA